MSTMSNSPADRVRAAMPPRRTSVAVLLLLAALAAPAGAERPLPARAVPQTAPILAADPAPEARRVRIVAAQMISLRTADSRLRALVGRGPDDPRDGEIVAVQVAEPFVGLTRSASPVIVIDGRPVESSVSPDARLVYALVPPGARREGPGVVQVGWLGDLARTISEPARLSPPR